MYLLHIPLFNFIIFMLEYKDLKKGEIYTLKRPGWSYKYIFKFKEDGYLNTEKLKNFNHAVYSSFYPINQYLEKATLAEARWLRECIKANKYIPFEEIAKTSQIKYEVYV